MSFVDKSKKFAQNTGTFVRFLQAGAVLYMDQRFKRNPPVASRLKHLKAYHDGLQLTYQDPAKRAKLPPQVEQQMKLMGPSLRMMEQVIKKNPNITMNELNQMAQERQSQPPMIRTRPGPPMKGKRR